jgi:hypothetical protein
MVHLDDDAANKVRCKMAWENILRVCKAVFVLSAAALGLGIVIMLPLMLGGSGWMGLSELTVTIGGSLMAVGSVVGGVTGLILLTS